MGEKQITGPCAFLADWNDGSVAEKKKSFFSKLSEHRFLSCSCFVQILGMASNAKLEVVEGGFYGTTTICLRTSFFLEVQSMLPCGMKRWAN